MKAFRCLPLTELGFTHRRITPGWPRANGEAERLMKTLEKAIRTAVIQGKNWKQELFTFLRQYRATPHGTTGKSPSELLNGRKFKSTLPRVHYDETSPEIRQADATRKEKMKEYADKCSNAKSTDLSVGDKVLIKQPNQLNHLQLQPMNHLQLNQLNHLHLHQ